MHVSVTEIARHFSEYLNRVSYRGESFLLVRGKKILAELHPAPQGRRLGDLPALFKALPRLDPKDAEALGKDVREIRKNPGTRLPADPWES